MSQGLKGVDSVMKGREAYSVSSSDRTGEHAASSTSTEDARNIKRREDAMVLEVMPLLLTPEDSLGLSRL